MAVRREVKRGPHPSTGRPMQLWLSRGDAPMYTLTLLPPHIRPVSGMSREESYGQPGDPVLIRHLCKEMTLMLFGQLPNRRAAVRVELIGRVLVEDASCVEE